MLVLTTPILWTVVGRQVLRLRRLPPGGAGVEVMTSSMRGRASTVAGDTEGERLLLRKRLLLRESLLRSSPGGRG